VCWTDGIETQNMLLPVGFCQKKFVKTTVLAAGFFFFKGCLDLKGLKSHLIYSSLLRQCFIWRIVQTLIIFLAYHLPISTFAVNDLWIICLFKAVILVRNAMNSDRKAILPSSSFFSIASLLSHCLGSGHAVQ
jgi:hypothetical protein